MWTHFAYSPSHVVITQNSLFSCCRYCCIFHSLIQYAEESIIKDDPRGSFGKPSQVVFIISHSSSRVVRSDSRRYPKTSGLLIYGSLPGLSSFVLKLCGLFLQRKLPVCVEFVLSSFLISSVGQSSLFISLLPNIISPSFRFFGSSSLSVFETFPFSSFLEFFVRSFSVINSFLLQTHPFIASNDDGNVDMISMWVCRQLEERRSRVHSMDSPSSE